MSGRYLEAGGMGGATGSSWPVSDLWLEGATSRWAALARSLLTDPLPPALNVRSEAE